MLKRLKSGVGPWLIVPLFLLPAFAQNPAPVHPPPEDGAVLVLPYVAVGGPEDGWHFQTLIVLQNPQASANSGSTEFFNNDGQPLPVRMNGDSEPAAQAKWTIAPRESSIMILTGSGDSFQAGWLRVKLAGKSKSTIRVTAVVQFYNGDYLAGEAGVVGGGQEGVSSFYSLAASRTPIWGLENPTHPKVVVLHPLPKRGLKAPPRLPALGYSGLPIVSPNGHRTGNGRFVETGYASWYGYPFRGRLAADGSVYDGEKLTAAHRTLAFGTRVKVTNLQNHKSVIVHINDRGPFVRGRIVDLSVAAAERLGLTESGIAMVRLEIIPPTKKDSES